MALRQYLASFATLITRVLFCDRRRHLFLLIVCLAVWVIVLVAVCSHYQLRSSTTLTIETHFAGTPLRASSHPRTLGLFGSAKCLLLDVDPFHSEILKNQWDLGRLKCHGGSTHVFFEENKLHVRGNGLRDVTYRGVKFSSSTSHTKGISYNKERHFPNSVLPLEKGRVGYIAHYLGKCIHTAEESEDPVVSSELMLHDGCHEEEEEEYSTFSFDLNGTLKHYPSGKCVVPLKRNNTVFLVFSSQCDDRAQFAPLRNGLLQHLYSQWCVHYDSVEDVPPNEVRLVLSSDCSSDLRHRFGWKDHFQRHRETVGDVELVTRKDVHDEFLEVQFISKETVPGTMEREYTFHILPKLNTEKRTSGSKRQMNVLLIMFHSTSNAQFQRQMPWSYRFLADELNSVLFKGFSVVGESTKSQLAAMLSGILPSDINKWDEESFLGLFKLAKSNGYVTLLSDDKRSTAAANSGAGRFKGETSPIDHYAAPFWTAAYSHSSGLESLCIGNRPIYTITLSYLKQFFAAYANEPKFALAMNTEISSWNTNSLGYADDEMAEFLKWMKEEGHLDNTVLVTFSDHGSRSENMRRTLQGKLEERTPFLSVSLPLKGAGLSSAFDNLKHNSKFIISPYDVYATLRSIISPTKDVHRYGDNLLDRLTVESRSCDLLNVPPHWCPCLYGRAANATDASLTQISKEIISSLNRDLATENSSCPAQTFSTLKTAIRLSPLSEVLRFKYSKNSAKCMDCEPVYGDVQDLAGDAFLALGIKVKSGQVYRAVVNYLHGSFHVHPHIDLIEGGRSRKCS